MVERTIGNVKCCIDQNKSNEVYFTKDFTGLIKKNGIGGILDAIFLSNENRLMPLSVFIEMTNSCNFSCPFCYINEQGKRPTQIPAFNEIVKDLDWLIKNGLIYCVLSGGECLAHPSFFEIYEYLKRQGVLVSVFTNAYLLTDKHFDLFEKYKPFSIEISLYGIDDKTYQTTTNTKNISAQSVYNNVFRLKSLGINVICKTPITKFTENFYPKIKLWCEKNGIQYYNDIEMLDTYSGKSTEEFKASNDVCDSFKNYSNSAFWNDDEIRKIIYSEKKCKFAFDCSGGQYDIFISSEYNLYPCMKAIGKKDWSFNVLNLGIEKCYQNLTKKINIYKGKKLDYCVGCNYHEICQECFFTQFDYENIETHRMKYCKWLKEYIDTGNIYNK